MLSVVVYGRNDNHGYNLHKRAALSINAIAETLSHSGDEIIFVDYNTPDEIPTFPQAIADTLTDKAREKLRIIRVRPSFHHQFAGKTRLVALEPHARNIGIRRSNPANSWVLSTNTDMVFAPRSEKSLSDLVSGLEEGFYHLPRFEVPEGFWESLDRKSPAKTIGNFRDWGKRYHLDEIVYGDFDNLYEAPGDFQLFTRGDLDRINGFDESMILGWHVDSNIARRMRMLRGQVLTLTDKLSGYHCSHTRQATIYHGHSRVENSLDAYCRNLTRFDIPEQAAHWGAPEIEFEEIRLDRHEKRYFSALDHAIPHGADITYEGRRIDDAPGARDYYEADHVLPYLCDLVSTLPAGGTVLFLGTDLRLAQGLEAFLKETLAARLVMASDWSHPDGAERTGSWDWRPFEDAVIQADAFVLQFPESGLGKALAEERWRTQESLERLADHERRRVNQRKRRIIVVNANDNPLQMTLDRTMSYTMMPYTCRLRHGYVLDAEQLDIPAAKPGSAEASFAGRLHRDRGFQPDEVAFLRKAATVPETPAASIELEALTHEPAQAAAWGIDVEQLPDIAVRAREHIAQAQARAAGRAELLGSRLEATTRLCSGSDWEDPRWRSLVARSFYEGPYSILHRTRWIWERIALLAAAEAHLPTSGRPWVLVTGNAPDVLPALLAMRGYRVAYGTLEEVLSADSHNDWADRFAHVQGLVSPDLHPFATLPPDSSPLSKGFEAIIVYENGLHAGSSPEMAKLLKKLDKLSRQDTLLLCTLAVRLDGSNDDSALSYNDWRGLFAPSGPLGIQGFTPAGKADFRIPLDTVVKFSNADTPGSIPGLSYGEGGAIASAAVVSARWPASFGKPAAMVAAVGETSAQTDLSLSFPLTSGAVEVRPRARNILPYLQSPDTLIRSPNIVQAETDREILRFGSNLDLGGASLLTLGISTDAAPESIRAQLTDVNGSIEGIPVDANDGRCTFEFRSPAPIDLAALHIGVNAKSLSIMNITATTQIIA